MASLKPQKSTLEQGKKGPPKTTMCAPNAAGVCTPKIHAPQPSAKPDRKSRQLKKQATPTKPEATVSKQDTTFSNTEAIAREIEIA